MPKALITGGAGFVGSRIVHRFVEAGYETYVFDTFKQYLIPNPSVKQHNLLVRLAGIMDQIELIQGNTLNKDFLRRALNRIKPNVIVHMAALPLAAMAIEHTEEAFESILNSTVNIMEVMRDFEHPCRLVYASSSMVYGDFHTEKVSEDAPKDPKEIYGSLKLSGEIIARGYMKRHGIDLSIVRPSAVYGPFDGNQRVLYKFITNALNGTPIHVDGDGSMKLDFTFVDDTAQGIFLLATHPKASGETFNITRGEAESLKQAIDIIQSQLPNVEVQYGPVPDHVPKRGTLDISKARGLLGYQPEYDLERGLSIYIEHLKNHTI